IRQRRPLLAAVELRTTERPIFDIAMDLGYVSQQTSSRVFRREFVLTPSDYLHRPLGLCPRIVRGAGVCWNQAMNSCGANAFAKYHP
ncbi:helix-turn-helix domain-containing protein, partial [Salmonella sp. 2019-SM259]|uniref:helix-turn-helix domain-containing protein n=1 Tax=Salmonella sp. 2019-SM259 TaxID=3068194 RepID=UPI00376FDA25